MDGAFSLAFERRIQARREEVFRAFTHATLLRDWLSHGADCDPRVGGHIFLRWRDGNLMTGLYRLVRAPEALEFSWETWQGQASSGVLVTLRAEGEGTLLRLEHRGPGAEPEGLARAWEISLENLQSVLETGIDLRWARRPRLGIAIDENFTPEMGRSLGVPDGKGIRLVGTAPGSGAEKAGLLKDDILVSLNGVALEGIDSVDLALRGQRAGDRAEVRYYRGGQAQTVFLELGLFPLPDLPADALELAARAERMYHELNQAMFSLFEGLSEERAGLRPAEGEWSVKELAAHFILMERDYQSWVADMLNDRPVLDDLQMRPNVTPRIQALLERFETLPALCKELEAAEAETLAMIRAFPVQFAAERKHLFRRAAQWALEVVPVHLYEEHMEQFKAAIQAAS